MTRPTQSRRGFLAATATGGMAIAAARTTRAASFGDPDEPPQGAISTQGNPASMSDPGPNNPEPSGEFPGAFFAACNRRGQPANVLGVI